MPVLLVLLTILFICVAFVTNQPQNLAQNSFIAYFFLEIQYILNNYIAFISGFLVLTLLASFHIHFHKKHPVFIKFLFASLPVIAASVLGFFLSFILLLIIAFAQLNMLAIVLNVNPKLAGVQTDLNIIAHSIIANNQAPDIIPSNTDPNKELLAVANTITGKDNFYGNYILSSIPKFFVLTLKQQESSMLLVDNSLIITKIDTGDLQIISPYVGNLFIKKYFNDRKIKAYPNVTLMDQQEFIKFREDDSNKTLASLNEDIKKVETNISSISAAIQNDKKNIIASQSATQTVDSQRASQYNNCISSGTSRGGTFYPDHTKQDCDNLLNQLKKAESQDNTNINNLNQKLQISQNQLEVYKYYDNSFKAQKQLIQIQKNNIPHEFGIFIPADTIKIALDDTNPNGLSDYFATLTHEYLHYASYISEKQSLTDSFFEEGLTEYFARMAIKDALNTNTNRGYPVQFKIISAMTNLIPESEFADIYFTKDQEGLEAALNRVYGDDFYTNNHFLFETLQNTTDPRQELKLANKIMSEIGGTPLKEQDLLSTYSKLQ